MRYLVITDDADRDEIIEAIGHLRAKRARACIASTRAEIDADVDELLDQLVLLDAVVEPA